MIDPEQASRAALIAKLQQSREEIRQLLDPPPTGPGAEPLAQEDHAFPRSRTMRALLSSKGLGSIGALAGGLLIARPGLALKLLRLVPASAVGKMLLAKAVTAVRSKYMAPH